jgi:hypothetical protein
MLERCPIDIIISLHTTSLSQPAVSELRASPLLLGSVYTLALLSHCHLEEQVSIIDAATILPFHLVVRWTQQNVCGSPWQVR